MEECYSAGVWDVMNCKCRQIKLQHSPKRQRWVEKGKCEHWFTCREGSVVLACAWPVSTEKLKIKHALSPKWCSVQDGLKQGCPLMYLSRTDLAVSVLPEAGTPHRGDFYPKFTQGAASHSTNHLPLDKPSFSIYSVLQFKSPLLVRN